MFSSKHHKQWCVHTQKSIGKTTGSGDIWVHKPMLSHTINKEGGRGKGSLEFQNTFKLRGGWRRNQAQMLYKLISKENHFYKKRYSRNLGNSKNCPPESLKIKELLYNELTLLYSQTCNSQKKYEATMLHPKVHCTTVVLQKRKPLHL